MITHLNFPRKIYVRGCLQPAAQANRRSNSLLVNTFQQEVTKVTRKGLDSDWAQIFLCPISEKDFNWFRNWSVKRRIPGARSFVLVNLAASTSS